MRDPIADHYGPGRGLKTDRFKHEIAVNVDRDGDVCFADGLTRLSIAKLLDFDAVPVRVLRRHRRRQADRDAAARGDPIPPGDDDHPDFAGLDRGDG